MWGRVWCGGVGWSGVGCNGMRLGKAEWNEVGRVVRRAQRGARALDNGRRALLPAARIKDLLLPSKRTCSHEMRDGSRSKKAAVHSKTAAHSETAAHSKIAAHSNQL